MPQLQKNPYSEVSAEDINKAYRDGYITASRKNELMRGKAQSNLTDLVNDNGVFLATYKKTIQNVQDEWDALKEIASQPKPDNATLSGAYQDTKTAVKAAWHTIQLAAAPFNAIGDVSGNVAEQMSLSAGASPGLAKAIGLAVNVGSGFVPVGGTVRQMAKSYQMAGGFLGTASKASTVKTAAKVAEEAAQAAVEKLGNDAIRAGLKTEGVTSGLPLFSPLANEAGRATVMSAKDEFLKSLRSYKSEIEAITKTKPHAQTFAEASKLGIGIEDLQALTPGTALKESEMAAYLKALDKPVGDLKEAAKGVLGGTVEGSQLGSMFQDFFGYSPKFRAAEVTAGRSVEILKETPPMKPLTDLMNAWDAESMAKLTPEQVWKNLAEDILAMEESGKLKVLQVAGAGEAAKSGIAKAWPMIREVYTNLLLARPVTQVRNFIGNVAAATTSVAEREVGGWLSIAQKGEVGLTKGSGVAQFQGMMGALGDGLSQFGKAFSVAGVDDISKLDFHLHQIPGPIGRIINIPGDTMGGMDAFFKAILKNGDIRAQAIEAATAKGLKGAEYTDYVTRRTLMPTSAMIEHAKAFALDQTFQNDLGTIASKVQGIAQAGPMALWFPFMKTPINLVKYAWDRIPGLQLLSKSLYQDIIEGGAKADQAIGRLTLSNMAGMFVFGLSQAGLLTGGGPVDPALRRSWLGTKQPYSIMGKDGWYQLSNLDPMTTPMALVSDFAEVMNQLDDPTAEQGAMAIGLSFTRDVADKTWWRTLGATIDLVSSMRAGEEWGLKAVNVALSPVTAVVTGGPLEQAAARIEDPVRREAHTYIDQLKSRVFGYSKDLPPMRDGYGDPILPPQTLGSKYLSYGVPFTAAPFQDDPIKKEGARLQINLPQFPWSTGGGRMRDDFDIKAPLPGEAVPVELSPQERDRWQVIYRNILRHPEAGLQALMDNPVYKNGTFALQRDLFSSFLAKSRDGAKAALLTENIPLAKKVVMASGGKYLPMIGPEQRPNVESQLTGQLDILDTILPQQRDNILKYGILDDGKARDEEVINPPKPEINPEWNVTYVP